MERPTKEQVDAAMAHYYDDAQCAIERGCAAVLAAEVSALRAENNALQAVRAELRESIARLLRELDLERGEP